MRSVTGNLFRISFQSIIRAKILQPQDFSETRTFDPVKSRNSLTQTPNAKNSGVESLLGAKVSRRKSGRKQSRSALVMTGRKAEVPRNPDSGLLARSAPTSIPKND